MAISPGHSIQTQTETSSLSLKEAYFLILKAKTSNTYLGVNCNLRQTPEKPTDAIIMSPSVPPQVTGVSVKRICAHVWLPRFCGCCQRAHSLITWFSGLRFWVQQESSKKETPCNWLPAPTHPGLNVEGTDRNTHLRLHLKEV